MTNRHLARSATAWTTFNDRPAYEIVAFEHGDIRRIAGHPVAS
jgi:hypothetical protein